MKQKLASLEEQLQELSLAAVRAQFNSKKNEIASPKATQTSKFFEKILEPEEQEEDKTQDKIQDETKRTLSKSNSKRISSQGSSNRNLTPTSKIKESTNFDMVNNSTLIKKNENPEAIKLTKSEISSKTSSHRSINVKKDESIDNKSLLNIDTQESIENDIQSSLEVVQNLEEVKINEKDLMEKFIQYFRMNEENLNDDLFEVLQKYGIDEIIYSLLKKYRQPETEIEIAIIHDENQIMTQFIEHFNIGKNDEAQNLVEALKKFGIETLIYNLLKKSRTVAESPEIEGFSNPYEAGSTRSISSRNLTSITKIIKVSPPKTRGKTEFAIDEDKLSIARKEIHNRQFSENNGFVPLSARINQFAEINPAMNRFAKNHPISVTGQQAPKDQLKIDEYNLREALKKEIAMLGPNQNSLLSSSQKYLSPPSRGFSQTNYGFDEVNYDKVKQSGTPHSPIMIGSLNNNLKKTRSTLEFKNKYDSRDKKWLEERIAGSPERIIEIDEELIREMYRALERKVEMNPSIKNLFKKYIGRMHIEHSPERVQLMENNLEFQIEYDDFSGYVKSFAQNHKKCGDSCIHLRRFFDKIGFQQLNPYGNRLVIALPTTNIDKLPQIYKKNYFNLKT